MNVRTTLLLTLLVGIGGGLAAWHYYGQREAAVTASKTLDFLDHELKPDALTRIELLKGKERRFLLERTGNDWSLPGKWPVRAAETQELLDTLTHLRSRFTPIATGNGAPLANYGLDDSALTLKLQVAGKERTLTIGEEPATQNRFNRATYVRLDNEPEIVRLGPGVVTVLDRPQDYFQQRRLFVAERVPKEEGSKEKVEEVQAQEIRVQGPEGKYTLARQAGQWQLAEPVTDRADPDKLKSLLAGFPDFWAERFVDAKGKTLADFGLEMPEYVLTVTRPGGTAVKLLVGKISETKEKVVMKPGGGGPFGPKPVPQFIKEEYRYAKLEANDQVFEIKTDKLKDVALKLDELRDPQLARFKTDDVRLIEIATFSRDPKGSADGKDKASLILVKDKDKWKLEQPQALDVETQPVNELLDKLAGLQARDKDVRDQPDLKALGLDKPHAFVKLSLEEGKDDAKEKKKREIVFQLGKSDKEKDKLFVRVEGWPRVNVLEDSLTKLVDRPALAYRARKVLDVASADITKIEIARAGESYTLQHKDNAWHLTQPAGAKADAIKADQLAGDLARLEAVEFVTPEKGKEAEADKAYGFDKSKLRATLHFKDEKKKPQTLVLGDQRPGKDDSYARIDSGPVFVVKKDVRELLERESLAYRPLQVIDVAESDVESLKIRKEGKEYALVRKDKEWSVTGPFEAKAATSAVEPLVDEIARLRGEKFVSHAAKEPGKFGLDKPYVEIEVSSKNEKDKKTETKKLKIGKPADGDIKGRYAVLGDDGAVFVVGEKAAANLAKDALDLLDKELASVSVKSIQRVEAKGQTPFTLEQKQDIWRVIGSPAPEFAAEEEAVKSFLGVWSNLRAEKIAAYGPKIDWKEYGLDKPASTVTVSIAAKDEDKDKPAKATQHSVSLGKEAGDGKRYARLDQQPAVVVLDAPTSEDLGRTHLDFLDHRVLKYDLDTVTGISRQMKDGDFELTKQGEQWRFAKPMDRPADDLTVGDVLDKTFRLRAKRIAAYPAKDLKPFGLEQPAAVVKVKLTDATGAPSEHVIKVGDIAPPFSAVSKKSGEPNAKGEPRRAAGERYAIIDKGETVVVLPAELSKHLTAPALHFADRNLASVSAPDRVVLERGGRKLTFARPETAWQMTAPIKAEAEHAALDDFLKELTRLRADEIVADKADPKQHGLDRPAAQWALHSGDKETLRLVVGNPEAGKEKEKEPRRYARLAGKDVVFLLNPEQSARALEEYRSRKPWAAFDAVQVEKLSYQGPAPFTLQKSENVWSVAGKPEAKVSSKAISDTLDALAGLKVERWLADEKGDLQLHGLQPPVWTIDAQTSSGKRSLLIGRSEGDSPRLYAAVAGESGIFVIGEEDARRIVRPLSAFLEK
jgi:hypothetical protein